jgi:diguanylate cyclase (GGDEF)-like protein/PAS domain S-box-containing protein
VRVPLNVLLIEDNADDAELTLRALQAGGFEPISTRVETAEAFSRALDRGDWQVIISDHRMPAFSSLEALGILLQRGVDLPFLLVSGTIGEEAAVDVMRAGAHDYILKNNLTRLCVAVERELREADHRRQRRKAEAGQAEAEERYRDLVEQIPAATYRITFAGNTVESIYVSPQIEGFTGYTIADWIGQPAMWTQTLHPDDRGKVLAAMRESRDRGEPLLAEYRVRCRDGSIVWLRNEARWSRNEARGRRSLQGFVIDITARRQAEETILHFAYHDALTGLPNGSWLRERLKEEIAEARSANRPLALLRISVRGLHEVNVTLGRDNGDRVLKEIASRLRDLEELRSVARLGAAEFAVLVVGSDAAGGKRLADRIVASLQDPIVVDGLPVELGAWVGIGMFPGHAEDAETLLRRADVALDTARRNAVDCALYSKNEDLYDPRRLVLMGDLRSAIASDQLHLEYQPKIHLQSRKIIGVEALVRWRHPEFGDVPPTEFVGLAEDSALIRPLTRWVLNEACRQSRAWRQARLHLPVAVNLSARNLLEPDLADHIAGLLETWGLEAPAIGLEVTESAIMAEPTRAARLLEQLSGRGMSIAIDDFGTGYSSLSYLRRLAVSEVKIDRSFVIGLSSDQGDLAIVRAVIDLGHRLDLLVVAEGIEDAKTWDLLAAAGCDSAQGYHMARPMTGADLARWISGSHYGLDAPPKKDDDPPGAKTHVE